MSSTAFGARLLLAVGLAAILFAIVLNAQTLFDLLAPPAVVFVNPVRVLSNPVVAGKSTTVVVTRTAWAILGSDPIQIEVVRRLVHLGADGEPLQPLEVWYLPSQDATVDIGTTTITRVQNIIPMNLPPGLWRFEGYATARHRTSPFYTEPIEVIAP